MVCQKYKVFVFYLIFAQLGTAGAASWQLTAHGKLFHSGLPHLVLCYRCHANLSRLRHSPQTPRRIMRAHAAILYLCCFSASVTYTSSLFTPFNCDVSNSFPSYIALIKYLNVLFLQAINSVELVYEAIRIIQARFYADFAAGPREAEYLYAVGKQCCITVLNIWQSCLICVKY